QAAPVKLENAAVAAIAGTLDDGEVVYGTATQLFVARAKGGTFAPDPAVKIFGGEATADLDGRIAVLWQPDTGKAKTRAPLRAQVLNPGADEPAVDLGSDLVLGAMCLTRDRAYAKSGEQLLAFGGTTPPSAQQVGFKALVGCTADAVLLRDANPAN